MKDVEEGAHAARTGAGCAPADRHNGLPEGPRGGEAEEASQQPVQAPASTSVQRQIHPHRTTRRDKSTEQQPRRVRRSTQKIKYLQSTYPLIIPQKMLVSRRCHPAGHALSKLQSSPEAMHKHPIRMKKLKSPPNSAALSRRRKVCGRRRRSHPSKKKKNASRHALSLSLKKQNAAVPMPHANFLVHHSF